MRIKKLLERWSTANQPINETAQEIESLKNKIKDMVVQIQNTKDDKLKQRKTTTLIRLRKELADKQSNESLKEVTEDIQGLSYSTKRDDVMMAHTGGWHKEENKFYAKDTTLHTNDGYRLIEVPREFNKLIYDTQKLLNVRLVDIATDNNLKHVGFSFENKNSGSSLLSLSNKFLALVGYFNIEEIRLDAGKVFIFVRAQ